MKHFRTFFFLTLFATTAVFAQKTNKMTNANKKVIEAYVESFNSRKGPSKLIVDDITFRMEDATQGFVKGRKTYLDGAEEFQGMIRKAKIDQIISEGDDVVIRATYNLELPTGHTHILKTMESFKVKNGKIVDQYFMLDTSAFYKFMSNLESSSEN